MTSAPTPDILPDSPAAEAEDDEKLSPGRIAAAVIFVLFALAFIAAGLILVAVPANHLPGLLGRAETTTHHSLRGVGSVLVGLAFAVSAWFALRYRSRALAKARAADLEAAGRSTAEEAASDAGPAEQPGPVNYAAGTGPAKADSH